MGAYYGNVLVARACDQVLPLLDGLALPCGVPLRGYAMPVGPAHTGIFPEREAEVPELAARLSLLLGVPALSSSVLDSHVLDLRVFVDGRLRHHFDSLPGWFDEKDLGEDGDHGGENRHGGPRGERDGQGAPEGAGRSEGADGRDGRTGQGVGRDGCAGRDAWAARAGRWTSRAREWAATREAVRAEQRSPRTAEQRPSWPAGERDRPAGARDRRAGERDRPSEGRDGPAAGPGRSAAPGRVTRAGERPSPVTEAVAAAEAAEAVAAAETVAVAGRRTHAGAAGAAGAARSAGTAGYVVPEPAGADPEPFVRFAAGPVDRIVLRAVLRGIPVDPDDAEDGRYVFADAQHYDVMAALGLEAHRLNTGYALLSRGYLPEGLPPQDLVPLGDAPR